MNIEFRKDEFNEAAIICGKVNKKNNTS